MNHDIDDLLEIIRELEKRIMKLENQADGARALVQHEDGWYWEYG